MIETLFSLDALATPAAFVLAFAIGCCFGVSLEQAGFGSSRRLAGIFYFTDMTVLKVMFSAVIAAMLGLGYFFGFGLLKFESLFNLETLYGPQIIGGLIFGWGFVLGGWCPGTAAVGLASGRIDAAIFLVGALIGSAIFNETFQWLDPLMKSGNSGIIYVYDSLGMTRSGFALGFTIVAIGSFWVAEYIEELQKPGKFLWRAPFLFFFSVGLLIAAGGLFYLPKIPIFSDEKPVTPIGSLEPGAAIGTPDGDLGLERDILVQVEEAQDHFSPKDLAEKIFSGVAGLLVVDLRPPHEYSGFHIRGSVNIQLGELHEKLQPYKNRGKIVLYSNGMTHPAQARDSLARMGFANVFLLTDGLSGFISECLKPASLRGEPVDPAMVAKILEWRNFFLNNPGKLPHSTAFRGHTQPRGNNKAQKAEEEKPSPEANSVILPSSLPCLIETDWLRKNLGKPGIKIIDSRGQPEYNSGHIPGSLSLNPESVRGLVKGIPSMLLPGEFLVPRFSMMGITAEDLVVLVFGDKPHDATLLGLALERLGHQRYAVLNGGFARWKDEKGPISKALPQVVESIYRILDIPDTFAVDSSQVMNAIRQKSAAILDVRPIEYFLGTESDEERAGRIPGALSRPYSADIHKNGDILMFKSKEDLEQAYSRIGLRKESQVIVHCRTGHQASQAYFVLKYILGYKNVKWYDGGWTEWSAKTDLPIASGTPRGN